MGLICNIFHRNQFKARPINTRILSNPNLGVKKVPTKPPTEPEEFTLSANLRKKDLDVKSGEKYEFHAQPINKKILEGPVVWLFKYLLYILQYWIDHFPSLVIFLM